MKKMVPVNYKGVLVGYANGDGNIDIKNNDLWAYVIENEHNFFISLRAIGKFDVNGKIISEKKISYDITPMTSDEIFYKKRESRNFGRIFEKDTLVMLDEKWMNDYERIKYMDLIDKVGIVLESTSKENYSIKIKWPGGIISDENGVSRKEGSICLMPPPISIIDGYYSNYLTDLQSKFPFNKVEFGRGERIIIDGKIVPGILYAKSRLPYKMNLDSVVEMIKSFLKL